MNPLRQYDDAPSLRQALTEKNILHETNPRESADLLKIASPQKQPLIAVDDSGEANTRRRAGVDRSKAPTFGADTHRETSGDNPRLSEGALDGTQCARIEPAIRMEKEQHVAACSLGARIHLKRPPCFRYQHTIRLACPRHGGVA